MKVIIPLAGNGTRMRPHSWSRAKPLLNVAGKTVIGHLLDMMEAVTTEEVIFVINRQGEQVEEWIRHNYPQLDAHFVVQEEALGQAHAIWLCRDHLDDSPVMVAFGDGIVNADYSAISDTEADAVCLVQEMEDPRTFGVAVIGEDGHISGFIEKPAGLEHKLAVAGIYWFRQGRQLHDALKTVLEEGRKTKGEYYLVDAYQVMLERGLKIAPKPTIFWLDAGKPDYMLSANARLLRLGYGSQDAVERSYADDFTVLPPVFIHETASVTNSVIGPYVNIEAGAVVQSCIISNSIIDAGAHLEKCILDGALVGENCRVIGKGKAPFIGDNAIVEY